MAQGFKRTLMALCAASLLTACGGGGSSGSSGSAEGFWVGTSTTGFGVRLAVLENGETWGLYTTNTAIVGALYGSTNSGGGTLSGSGSDFNFVSRQLLSGSYSGTYTSKGSLNATTSGGVNFSGTYSATYDSPASLSAAAGTYAGTGLTKATSALSTTVTVAASGAITANNGFCTASGTMTPRPSGKGIFNVSLTFSGTNCALTGTGTISGVAYYEASNRSLVALGLNGAKTDGFFWVGAR